MHHRTLRGYVDAGRVWLLTKLQPAKHEVNLKHAISSHSLIMVGCLYNDSNELDNWPWRLELRLHMQLEVANVIVVASISL
jgi:hypothetical protein